MPGSVSCCIRRHHSLDLSSHVVDAHTLRLGIASYAGSIPLAVTFKACLVLHKLFVSLRDFSTFAT